MNRWPIVTLALVYTLLNALKPLHMDDAAYYAYARQAALNPRDPYGFAIFWGQHPEPAFEVMAPPGLPYWWSLALRVTDEPWLWKMWLLPLVFLLVSSLHFLFRRFAPGLALPLTALTLLSSAFLPSLNLMLDIPAQALGLGALCLYLFGAERGSPSLVALSGALTGFAMQTKYNAILVLAVMLLYSLTHRSLRWWPLSLVVALCVFISWESFVAACYGQSHFLHHLTHPTTGDSLSYRASLLPALLMLTGSAAPALLVLALAALGVPRGSIAAAMFAVVLAHALVATLATGAAGPPVVQSGPPSSPAEWIFLILGLAMWVAIGFVALRLRRPPGEGRPAPDPVYPGSTEWFLILWLGLELLGFFVFTPYPAVRRVLGVVVVITVLAGRLAARTLSPARRNANAALVLGLPLGLLAFLTDLRAAEVQSDAARLSADWIRKQTAAESPRSCRIWYSGHWGFQHYAEREGFRPLIPSYPRAPASMLLPEPSKLRRCDWLVVPDERIDQPRVSGHPMLRLAHQIDLGGRWPVSTVPFFYSGNVALGRLQGSDLGVRIYRVTADLGPLRGWSSVPAGTERGSSTVPVR